ncbi:hypothetical protein QUC31_015545 [Theobroma cacao]
MVLLWLSPYTNYKARLHHTAINLQLFIVLLPFLLILFMISFSSSRRLAFWQQRLEHETVHRSGGLPWGIAMLVGVVLVLLSYQSSFHSKWFGPLWRSD